MSLSERLVKKYDKPEPEKPKAAPGPSLFERTVLQTLEDLKKTMQAPAPVSYQFDIQRGQDGRMEAVVARPITSSRALE